VRLLTIGEFARASRLSPKALRLYDELGLLRPVRVDEYSGYRYYSPDQLDQARLVAWLRRAGLPLATIAEINGRPPAEVAAAVTAFLRVAEADFSERKRGDCQPASSSMTVAFAMPPASHIVCRP